MEAVEEIANAEPLLTELPRINTIGITLDHLFQCGVDDFLMTELNGNHQTNPLLIERTIKLESTKTKKTHEAIHKIFDHYLPEDYYKLEKYNGVSSITTFLDDLIIGSNNNAAIMRNFKRLPEELGNLKEVLPLELYKPIEYLLNSIQKDSLNLPHVARSIANSDIKRFQQIFEKKAFLEYKLAHGDLDLSNSNKTQVVNDIQQKGETLYKRYSGLIDFKKSLITTLTFSSKLIDLSFGKLPSTIADQFISLLSGILNNERRVVIYDYSPLWDELVFERLKPIIDQYKKEQAEKSR